MNRQISALFVVFLAACPGGGGGGGGGGTKPTAATCGNEEINGFELCDGPTFVNGAACSGYGLADGNVSCTSSCTLDFSTCSYRDYCTANNLYNDGACDPCDVLGGVRDPDCDTLCGADGTCADKYDPLVDAYTCRRLGLVDPDCGQCGNRIREGNELCDGTAFDPNAFKCTAYGFYAGEIKCRQDCGPDFSGCVASDCGDGKVEGLEECDGSNVGGKTCADYGGVAGAVVCTADCKIDATACVEPGCNNGVLEAGSEECDGEDLGGASCTSRGFVAGELGCTANCDFDEAACVAAGCQNGVKESTEDCEFTDGVADLGGATCESLGFLQGEVTCSPESCKYDTSACVAAGCGNGVVESPAEECEVGQTKLCNQLGFTSGDATCDTQSCKWVKTACTGGCGNGVKDGADQCDGSDLGGAGCGTLGFSGGSLSCNASCQYDTSRCSGTVNKCGNGVKDPGELCDGNQIDGGLTCANAGLGSGTVTCNANCLPVFSGCSTPDFCDHGAVYYYGDGVCDACKQWGGGNDPDCGCAAGNGCEGYFEVLAGWHNTCDFGNNSSPGAGDPDCYALCGNNTIDANPKQEAANLPMEACDGTAFPTDWNTCQKFGFSGGTLKCTGCRFDFSSCTP
ncbi:MAG: hypothetical protein KC635_20955 [Myxococcales bacterium]|nr:hypothetical protein [Myxococcales bacterium]